MSRERKQADAIARPVPEAFRTITWNDLEAWSDSRSVQRGKSYVGNVSDEGITAGGHIVATVSGREDYATEVWFDDEGLQGRCSCPVGHRCKHTVALVLACIDRLNENRPLPLLDSDDERLEELQDDDLSDDEEEAIDGKAAPKKRSDARPADEVDRFIDDLDAAAAKRLIRELLAQEPTLRTDLARRIKTDRGGCDELLKMARKELKRLAREPAYVNPWEQEYCVPDYSPLRRILEKLLEKKAYDDLVAFGDSLKEETFPQIESADDEGDTATQICECMEVVAKALPKSSLSSLERLRWLVALHADDGYCAYADLDDPFDHPKDWPKADWSALADELHAELDAHIEERKAKPDDSSGDYAGERILNRLCAALQNANRGTEARAFRISWLENKHKYNDLARLYFDENDWNAAWETAVKGLSHPSISLYSGKKVSLQRRLADVAEKRGEPRLSLAIHADIFFDNPSEAEFSELLKEAKKERLADSVRPWLLRFLETGVRPDDASPQAAKPSVPWPLPSSGLPTSREKKKRTPFPAVRLEISLLEKDPDEILRCWNAMPTARTWSIYDRWDDRAMFSDTVADAIAKTHPEEALRIWNEKIERELPVAHEQSYLAIADALRKCRPVMERLSRAAEWTERVRVLQTEYKRRTKFVAALSKLVDPPTPPRPIAEIRQRHK